MFLSNQVQAQPDQTTITLGDPLIFRALQWLFFGYTPEGTDLLLHPIAFAGWVGLFVTALNLLPISQLDGGHINYALFGRRSRAVSIVAFVGLGAVTIFYGYQYTLILILLWFMGIAHPPTLNDTIELGPARRRIGVFLGSSLSCASALRRSSSEPWLSGPLWAPTRGTTVVLIDRHQQSLWLRKLRAQTDP